MAERVGMAASGSSARVVTAAVAAMADTGAGYTTTNQHREPENRPDDAENSVRNRQLVSAITNSDDAVKRIGPGACSVSSSISFLSKASHKISPGWSTIGSGIDSLSDTIRGPQPPYPLATLRVGLESFET